VGGALQGNAHAILDHAQRDGSIEVHPAAHRTRRGQQLIWGQIDMSTMDRSSQLIPSEALIPRPAAHRCHVTPGVALLAEAQSVIWS
jgi:hypothetical protein